MFKTNSKKVLIITYNFPPEVGGVSVLRVVKFAKWLKVSGWEPIILTVKRLDTMTPDPFLLKDIEGIKIYRCRDYFRGIIRDVIINLASLKGRTLKVSSSASREVRTVRYGIIRRILSDLILIPDECFGWIVPAIISGRKIIKREDIGVIFTTSHPVSSHLVGYALKKICHIPLVVDFRDRWMGHPQYGMSYFSWRRNINKWLEKLIVNGCDRVVTVTEGLAKYFRDTYKTDKVSLIFNGYDEDDFNFEIPVRQNKDKLVFSHVGSVGKIQDLQPMISALEGLDEELLNDIEINFVGKLVDVNRLSVEKGKAMKSIKILGFQSHQDALKMMKQSDILLIILTLDRDGYFALTGKIFEYIHASRPVLALCPRNSELWDFINKYNLGICVESTDVEGIKGAIEFIHKKWKEGTLNYNTSSDLFEKFSRKKQAQELIGIFEQI